MDELQLKGLCYNYDDKYFSGHNCKEQNIFMAISEDISEEDVETPLVFESSETPDITPPSEPPKVETCHLPKCSHYLLYSPNPQDNRLHQL
jgi:hypothetical protein